MASSMNFARMMMVFFLAVSSVLVRNCWTRSGKTYIQNSHLVKSFKQQRHTISQFEFPEFSHKDKVNVMGYGIC